MIRITFEIPDDTGPALLSAIDEISNRVGGRLEEATRFSKEDAWTRAVRALGPLRAELYRVVKRPDPDYEITR